MKFRYLAAASAAALALSMTASPALAHGSGHHPAHQPGAATEVAAQLISPLKVAFGPKGSYLVAESFAGQLSKIDAKGKKTTVVNAPGQEIGGVSYANGTTYYLNNDQSDDPSAEPGAELLPARLMSIDSHGKTRMMADLSKFEAAHNPDGKTVYGLRDASPACLAKAPYLRQTGEVFSHPYSSSPGRGGVFVGDAGANNIVFVSNSGKVRLVKQLPAEPIVVDAAVVALGAEMGMPIPDCAIGLKYYAQPVPTDIEVNGRWVYYTVLPGVPGESLGVGKAYRTNIVTGRTELLAKGLAAPTGIAVGRDDKVYVAQLLGDGVSVLKHGKPVNVLPAAMAADVAVSGHTLAAVTEALMPTGKLMTVRLR